MVYDIIYIVINLLIYVGGFMEQLPEGYREIKKVNLQKDKKAAFLINIIVLIIMIPLLILGIFIKPIIAELDELFLSLLIILALLVVYVILHEAVHGIVIFKYTNKKPKFGYKGLYAFTGSDSYFNKKQYIIIALAPVIFWGIVLLILNLILPFYTFWIVYFIQVSNLSGAAGDIYITQVIKKMPSDVLIKDTGVEMTIYSKQ